MFVLNKLMKSTTGNLVCHRLFKNVFATATRGNVSTIQEECLDNITPPPEVFLRIRQFVLERKWVADRQLEYLINHVETYGLISQDHTSFIIECCGSLLIFETKKDRQKIAENVWKIIKNSGYELSIENYNVFLKTHLENDEDINVQNFLKDISDAGLKPNKDTYLCLFSYYCEMGNVAEANNIINTLKADGLKLTEKIFNSFIIGHTRAKDLNKALSTINNMKEEEITFGEMTYETLLQIYAELNKEKEVELLLNNASDFCVSNKCFLNMHYFFLKNNNKEAAAKIYIYLGCKSEYHAMYTTVLHYCSGLF